MPRHDDHTQPTRRPRRWSIGLAAAATALLAAGVWAIFLRPPPAPRFAIRTASESEILQNAAASLTVFRFAENPAIVVLDFPTLEEQGLMLDRVAALIEKAGLPRDRVLADEPLFAAIRADGDTVATWYYGDDYSAASLARFMSLANKDGVKLNPEEDTLRALMQQLGWFKPQPRGALITITRAGADPGVTQEARATILHHELSHGEFFTDPAYASYVRHFWLTELTPQERAGVRNFLGSQEYDTSDEELMYNEMQAYLMFTTNPHFFLPSSVGITAQRRRQLQTDFANGLAVPWLRKDLDNTIATASN